MPDVTRKTAPSSWLGVAQEAPLGQITFCKSVSPISGARTRKSFPAQNRQSRLSAWREIARPVGRSNKKRGQY
jgi:hypothetical protein